jgi:hypothetical protein
MNSYFRRVILGSFVWRIGMLGSIQGASVVKIYIKFAQTTASSTWSEFFSKQALKISTKWGMKTYGFGKLSIFALGPIFLAKKDKIVKKFKKLHEKVQKEEKKLKNRKKPGQKKGGKKGASKGKKK